MAKEKIKVGKEEIELEDDARALTLAIIDLTTELRRISNQ